jgi:DNA adenine methylase
MVFSMHYGILWPRREPMINYYSPLRYPGGKQKLANYLARVCEINRINGHYVEPYAGGAAIALHLLIEGVISEITINDKDRSIYAFWYSVLNYTDELCNLISKTHINVHNWRKQKKIQKRKGYASLLELGFSTFFLNRTNRSGIIDAGPIGGVKQDGEYKINCRYNKIRLVACIRKIAEYKDKIHVRNLDALELIKEIEIDQTNKDKMFYFDPPYYLKGESLYLNSYLNKDHKDVARAIKSIRNAYWIVTYDNTLPIRELYKSYRSKKYTLRHIANIPKVGKEIMFLSNNLSVPKMIFTSN